MRSFVEWITQDSDRERRFLITLSLLEFIGCRKIVRTLSYREVSLEVLQHISEEAGHSYLLRKAIKNIWGWEGAWDEEPWTESAWSYFNGLEKDISSVVKDPKLCYPIMSQIVEKRVLAFYPLLLELSKQEEVKRVVRFILAQEKQHARFFDIDFPECEKFELHHYNLLVRGLTGEAIHDSKEACERVF